MIETTRLLIRRLTLADLDALAAMRANPEVMRFINTPEPQTRDVVRKAIERAVSDQDEHGFARWAVADKRTGELIGWCGLAYLDNRPPQIEIGYGFAKPHWGKGYATEAARAVLRYGFEQLRIDAIVAVASPENLGSRHVMEKLGFTYKHDGFYWGTNCVYYELNREDFKHHDEPYRVETYDDGGH